MKNVVLKKNEDRRIRNGHQWVFSNEISGVDDGIINGDIIQLLDYKSQSLGFGFYNKNSLISVRLLSPFFNNDLYGYFKFSLAQAYNYRKKVYPERDSFRMVFSESDFLPGLIIDKYNNTFVLQVYCYGIQRNIDMVIDILKNLFDAKNIFTKNDFYFRKLEGLPETDELFSGETGTEIINDGLLKYLIDFSAAQKTGFYFDQCDNRLFLQKFAKNAEILDCFCNTGGFGLHVLYGGADSVTFVDSSQSAIKSVRENCKLNKFDKGIETKVYDSFDFLENCIANKTCYDLIILDPPAFAKSKSSLPVALKAYSKLNKLAFQCLKEGGILATSSCSHHVAKDSFIQSVNTAASKLTAPVQLIHFNSASLDHPQLPSMPETDYLKFAVFRKL